MSDITREKEGTTTDIENVADTTTDTVEAEVQEQVTDTEDEISEKADFSEDAEGGETTDKSEDNENIEKAEESENTETSAAAAAGVVIDEAAEAFIDKDAFMQAEKAVGKRRKIILSLAGVFILAYFVMVALCCFMYYPMTVINGKSVTLMSPSYVSDMLEAEYEDYSITVTYRNGEQVISGSDIDLNITFYNSCNNIRKAQNPFLWFSAFYSGNSHEAHPVVTYSEEKLRTILEASGYLDSDSMTAPEKPHFVINNDETEIEPGNKGTLMRVEDFNERLSEKIYSLETEMNVDSEDLYVKSAYDEDSEEVLSALSDINGYVQTDVTLTIGELDIEIPKEDILNMLSITSDYRVRLDKGKVRDYVLTLDEEYSTLGKERRFKTSLGDYVSVIGESYGWDIDEELETEALYNDILAQDDVTREISFAQKGYTYDKNGDIGDTYAEVDLTNQHMYFYKDGELIMESDFVSGHVVRGNNTPGGLYYLKYKTRDAILRGGDYATPVAYWMPFNRGIGFHDAWWRGSFGGDIYVTDGSHGCINLPTDQARILYNAIETGTPVVCYWR